MYNYVEGAARMNHRPLFNTILVCDPPHIITDGLPMFGLFLGKSVAGRFMTDGGASVGLAADLAAPLPQIFLHTYGHQESAQGSALSRYLRDFLDFLDLRDLRDLRLWYLRDFLDLRDLRLWDLRDFLDLRDLRLWDLRDFLDLRDLRGLRDFRLL